MNDAASAMLTTMVTVASLIPELSTRLSVIKVPTGKTAVDGSTQEREPPGAVFGGDHIDTKDHSTPVRVHTDRDDGRAVDDAATFPTFWVRASIHPQA